MFDYIRGATSRIAECHLSFRHHLNHDMRQGQFKSIDSCTVHDNGLLQMMKNDLKLFNLGFWYSKIVFCASWKLELVSVESVNELDNV